MKSRCWPGLAFSLGGLAVALAAWAAPVPPAAHSSPPSLNADYLAQAKALYSIKCSACHNLPNPQAKDYTRVEWQNTVNRMLINHHASDSISNAQAAQIVDYLATFAPEQNSQRLDTTDPWDTDSLDVWSVAPTVSHAYTFEEPHALAPFAALNAGAAGPDAVWTLVRENATPDGTAAVVHLVKPNPNRFALLMDRTDQAKNLDVQIHFRIISGHLTPAVGIVFGFSSPSAYSVLTYNQSRNTLALIQVSKTTHTTLQTTPINLPALPIPAAATSTSSTQWHTLRLLINDGQVHGWLDRSKRISVADSAYQGGKVGLWAQGDTVAAFDDWTIDVYGSAAPSDTAGA